MADKISQYLVEKPLPAFYHVPTISHRVRVFHYIFASIPTATFDVLKAQRIIRQTAHQLEIDALIHRGYLTIRKVHLKIPKGKVEYVWIGRTTQYIIEQETLQHQAKLSTTGLG